MAENINDDNLENLPVPQSENPSDENIFVNDTDIIIPKQETENMEVHHHPDIHHKPKKWKEYFLEFLMIFLAVTLGFFAENFREHRVEREKERHIIESLAQCLASDTIQLEKVINQTTQNIVHLDNFNKLKNADLTNLRNRKELILEGLQGTGTDLFFKTNDGALQQLKSSGMFNLIHKQSIIDSILKYDLLNKTTVYQETDYYHIFTEAFTSFRQVVDLSFLRDTASFKYNFGNDRIDFEFKNIGNVGINGDKEKLKFLQSDAAILAGTEDIYISCLKNQRDYGKRLIDFLKKEYDIE
jgi:hypothetical protein